jgi:uncharacterized protein
MYIALLLVLLVTGFLLGLHGFRRKSRARIFGGVGLVIGTLAFFGLMSFWGEMLGFEELGFIRRFWIQIIAEVVVVLVGATIAAGLVWLATVPLRSYTSARWAGIIAGGGLWSNMGCCDVCRRASLRLRCSHGDRRSDSRYGYRILPFQFTLL